MQAKELKLEGEENEKTRTKRHLRRRGRGKESSVTAREGGRLVLTARKIGIFWGQESRDGWTCHLGFLKEAGEERKIVKAWSF